jgi:PEP-CTERM motif
MYMKTVRWMLIALLHMSGLCGLARANEVPILTLDPLGGAISGAAGATVGWGFTISNTVDFLLVTNSDFCVGPITSPCTNSLGTYTDFIASNQFVVVGPPPESSPVSQAFDPTALTGVGSFAINLGAQPGDSAIGQIVLTYDLFSVSPNDPTFDPAIDTLSNGDLLTAPASVMVGAPPVPEPTTLMLFGTGLLGLALRSRRRKPL